MIDRVGKSCTHAAARQAWTSYWSATAGTQDELRHSITQAEMQSHASGKEPFLWSIASVVVGEYDSSLTHVRSTMTLEFFQAYQIVY
jgi:hypothetical protein